MAKWTCKIVYFLRNCEMETVVTFSTTDGNDSYHELAPSFFEEMTRFWRQNHCRRRPDNPNGPLIFRKYRVYLPLLRLFTSARSRCCSAANGSGSCQAPSPSYFEEMTRCRRQKLHCRWPGNPNGRSKLRNLGLFTFTRSQLTLRRRLRGLWRLLEIAQTTRNRRQNIAGWPGSIEIPQIWKFMPMRSSKTSRKTSFCRYERRCGWRHCAQFFFLLSLAKTFVFTFEK